MTIDYVFFPGVFLSSRVTGACPVTDLIIMRVNVRTSEKLSPVCTCTCLYYSSFPYASHLFCILVSESLKTNLEGFLVCPR